MKGGHTPIHIQRWAPADYQSDEHVQLLIRRRAWGTLTFYRQFLDQSFLAGGDLPAEPEALAACVRMPVAEVLKALQFCLGRLLIAQDGRIFQKRVRREVVGELEYRREQSELGKLGGRPKTVDKGKGAEKGTLSEKKSPPSPSPAPSSAPAPSTDNQTPVNAGGLAPSTGTNVVPIRPPARPAFPSLDHDPKNEAEALLAGACWDLALMYASSHDDRDVTDEDCRHALEAATLTTEGKSMDAIRGAPAAWLRTSIQVAERMKREWRDDEGIDTRPKNQFGAPLAKNGDRY